MSVIGIEVQAAEKEKGLKPTAMAQPAPEITLSEKCMVTARAATCKCIVTSVCTLDRKVQSLAVRQCQKDHGAVMKKLQSAAEFRVLAMIDCFEAVAK